MQYAKNTLVRAALALAIAFPLGASSIAAEASPLPTTAVVKKKKAKHCSDPLIAVLRKVGFRGENLKEAWAIAMRESGGRADAVSATNDHGLFQWNYAAWHKADWWNTQRLHTKEYNASVAYRISRGGKTWYPWDIDGRGRHKGQYTSDRVYAAYQKWYQRYPCAI